MFDPQKFMTNPLFLGGAALLSGEGFGSAMQGMRAGQLAQQQAREQEEAEKRRQQFLSLLNSPEVMANKSINPQMLMAMGPEAGLKHLANEMDPVTLLQRRQMEENLALMPLKRRQMERELAQPVGGANPETFYGSVQFEQTPDNQVRGFIIGNRGTKKYIDAGEGGQLLGPEGIAAARASGAARGKFEGGADQRNVGKERLTGQLKEMVGNYLELDKMGGIVNPDRGAIENLKARAASSEAGQAVSGAVGSPTQSIRRQIVNIQPLLLQGIMQASGMGARAMDSNKELQFYLQAASDPTSGDIYSNLVAIDVLDKTYGLGNVLDDTLPPEVLARVRRGSEQAIKNRPIPSQPQTQPPAQQAAPATGGGLPPGEYVYNPATGKTERR